MEQSLVEETTLYMFHCVNCTDGPTAFAFEESRLTAIRNHKLDHTIQVWTEVRYRKERRVVHTGEIKG